MENIQINIKDGIKLHIIPNDIYKTNLIRIAFTIDADKDTVTDTAMLPLILKQGSMNYPTQEKINTRLEELYGAEFVANIDKKGDLQVISFEADCIKDKYIPTKESITKEVFDLIFDIVLNPLIEDGAFNNNYLDIEKEKLKKMINELVDDKDAYSYYNCIHEMFGDEGYGLYQMGIESEVEKIDSKSLYEYYQKFIDKAKIDIFVSGEVDSDAIKTYIDEKVKDLKSREFDATSLISTISAKNVDNPKEIFEKLDVTQGKLVMGCTIDSKQDNKNYIGLVYNSILGSGASSLLFQNVREKASLAYYAVSRFIDVKSLLFIRAGIEIKNYNKALNLIKEQMNKIIEGDFTQENIDDAKTTLYSNLRNVPEAQESSINYYFMQEFYTQKDSIESLMEKIEAVSREEIIEFAKSVKLNVIYFLKDNN
jgi:predicted Zn-dependent peptidase